MQNRNLNILITGASSGIGEALAIHYAKTCAKNLFICGRNPDRLKVVENKCRNFGSVVYSKIFHAKNYYINLMITKIKKLCYNTNNIGDNFVGE